LIFRSLKFSSACSEVNLSSSKISSNSSKFFEKAKHQQEVYNKIEQTKEIYEEEWDLFEFAEVNDINYNSSTIKKAVCIGEP